jgi:hypothetical protein
MPRWESRLNSSGSGQVASVAWCSSQDCRPKAAPPQSALPAVRLADEHRLALQVAAHPAGALPHHLGVVRLRDHPVALRPEGAPLPAVDHPVLPVADDKVEASAAAAADARPSSSRHSANRSYWQLSRQTRCPRRN